MNNFNKKITPEILEFILQCHKADKDSRRVIAKKVKAKFNVTISATAITLAINNKALSQNLEETDTKTQVINIKNALYRETIKEISKTRDWRNDPYTYKLLLATKQFSELNLKIDGVIKEVTSSSSEDTDKENAKTKELLKNLGLIKESNLSDKDPHESN